MNGFHKDPSREHPSSPELMSSLRWQWLNGTMASKAPKTFGPSDVIAVLMDIGVKTGFVTFASAYDGTASLYTDTGGGIIGGGFHVPSAAASLALIECARAYFSVMPVSNEFPKPNPGCRSFWLISRKEVHGSSVRETDIKEDSPLNPLFQAGEDLITNLRLVDTRIKRDSPAGPADHIHIYPDGGICILTYGNPTPTFLSLGQLEVLLRIAKQRHDHLDLSVASGDSRLQEPVMDRIRKSGVDFASIGSPPGLILPKGSGTLHHAAVINREDIINDLFSRGADINAKDDVGYTPLAIAAFFGRTSLVKKLIEAHADVQAQDNQGNTVLMFAAQFGDPEAVMTLINSGANTTIRAKNGYTALKIAKLCSQAKVVELLEGLKSPE